MDDRCDRHAGDVRAAHHRRLGRLVRRHGWVVGSERIGDGAEVVAAHVPRHLACRQREAKQIDAEVIRLVDVAVAYAREDVAAALVTRDVELVAECSAVKARAVGACITTLLLAGQGGSDPQEDTHNEAPIIKHEIYVCAIQASVRLWRESPKSRAAVLTHPSTARRWWPGRGWPACPGRPTRCSPVH